MTKPLAKSLHTITVLVRVARDIKARHPERDIFSAVYAALVSIVYRQGGLECLHIAGNKGLAASRHSLPHSRPMWALATDASIIARLNRMMWRDIRSDNPCLYHVASLGVCAAIRKARGNHHDRLTVNAAGAFVQDVSIGLCHGVYFPVICSIA